MRRGMGSPKFIFNNEKMVGIHIPADFCAEHEWGIKGIYERFGIAKPQKGLSLKQFKITKVPSISLVREGKNTYLFTNKYEFNAVQIPSDLNFIRDGLCGAWDSESFGISTDSKDHAERLVSLKKEIDDCNIAIYLSYGKNEGNPFANAGLTILICSEIPDKTPA